MPSSVTKGLARPYFKWTDITIAVQWHVNGCRDEPQLPIAPVMLKKMDTIMQICELLENTDPASITSDFCARVCVPPFNSSYLVRLGLSLQRQKKYSSSSRPAGGRAAKPQDAGKAFGTLVKLKEAGKRKRVQEDAVAGSEN
ncbi:hypothetical protein COCOBI_02-5730 [Coccomyxa sp. Obi]|nr:hypothetical protein COCOBI_02-5730 [Coccomyxa sp. Obi]